MTEEATPPPDDTPADTAPPDASSPNAPPATEEGEASAPEGAPQ